MAGPPARLSAPKGHVGQGQLSLLCCPLPSQAPVIPSQHLLGSGQGQVLRCGLRGWGVGAALEAQRGTSLQPLTSCPRPRCLSLRRGTGGRVVVPAARGQSPARLV